MGSWIKLLLAAGSVLQTVKELVQWCMRRTRAAGDPINITGNKKPVVGTSERHPKPAVKWVPSPNFSARTHPIQGIVMHYTASSNVAGTLAWFSNPKSRVSAHYVIDRKGKIYQCVNDSEKAWHCRGHNNKTIGIEHVAAPGQEWTLDQRVASEQLLAYLVSEYKIPVDKILPHGQLGNTACPGDLIKDFEAWRNEFEVGILS